MRKKLATVTAHPELTVSSLWAHRVSVSSRWPKWSQPAVTSPWLSCDLAVTEMWPRRDWAVTSPSRDWAVIIGPGAVTTVVTVSSWWAHGDNFFLMGYHMCLHGNKLNDWYHVPKLTIPIGRTWWRGYLDHAFMSHCTIFPHLQSQWRAVTHCWIQPQHQMHFCWTLLITLLVREIRFNFQIDVLKKF